MIPIAPMVPISLETLATNFVLSTSPRIPCQYRKEGFTSWQAFSLTVPTHGSCATPWPDNAGRAQLSGLTPGAYKVTAQMRVGNGATWLLSTTTAGVELDGIDREIALDLNTGTGVIEGVVTQNGKPVVGELVAVRVHTGATPILLVSFSQSDGSYRVEGVPDGGVALVSGPSIDALESRQTIIIEQGQVQHADIAL